MSPRIRVALILCLSSIASTAMAAVGRTPGQFAVSPTGSAQYSIPLWTPIGIRGIQPQLALMYDSHLSYGLMGRGWTLNGMSIIARCNLTYAQDGAPAPITLTAADGLCLDGNRLRSTSAGVYQTEIANFAQVTALGTAGSGPSYFTVLGKDGLTYEYGNTTDSKILSSGSSTPYLWALDKVTDRAGNQMTYTYYQAGGAYVPLSIQYTAPSGSTSFPYQVNFGYSTKSTTDTLSRYIAGASVQQTQQLSTITMTSSGTTVREYKLSYTTSSQTGRATLTSIQECGGSAGTDCLAATSIGYQAGASGVASPTATTGTGATNGTAYSVDIDGDGKQDLVFATTSGSNYVWWVQLATSSGYGTPVNTGITVSSTANVLLDDFDGDGRVEILAPVGTVWYVYHWNGSGFTATSTATPVDATLGAGQATPADFDGDGLPDLVTITGTTPTYTIAMRRNTSSGGTVSFASSTTSILNVTATGAPQIRGNNSYANSPVKHMDFNGDGRDDILVSYYQGLGGPGTGNVVYAYSYNGTTFVLSSYFSGTLTSVVPLRFNDDNCTDLASAAAIAISQCNGALGSGIATGTTWPIVAALDWDGDGRDDLLVSVNGTLELYQSEGNAPGPLVSTGITLGSGSYVVTDQNGDGLDDFALANSAASGAIYLGIHNGPLMPPDLATSFTDGFGNSASPTYASITQQSDYYPWTDQTFPYQNYLAPLYVVNQATFSDPSSSTAGATYYQQYWYAGASRNLQGRGFAGFGSFQTHDSRSGLWDTKEYNRAFPYIGELYYRVTAQDNLNAHPIATFNPTWATLALDGTANNERVFPYISASTTANYEMGGSENGQLISTIAASYGTPDGYGNFNNVSTTATDQDSGSPNYGKTWTSTVANTITPNQSTWCFTLPTQTTLTNSSTATNGASITRTVAYTPDYTNCRETTKVIEPSSSTYKVTETYGFDAFGNIGSIAVAGVGMSTRTTTINWGSSGQFPTTITNPLSQSITLGYDPKSGMKTSQTDPNYTSANPLTTSWTYDDFARRTQETRPDGTYTVWSYNDCANWGGCLIGSHALAIAHYIYANNNSVMNSGSTYYDPVDRPLMANTTMLAGGYDRNEVRYDSLGRLAKQAMPCTYSAVSAACPYWTTNLYDALNRMTQSQRPISATNSSAQTTSFGYAGRTSTVQDALGNTTAKVSLVTGKLAQSKDAKGYYQTFSYDSFGSLKSVVDTASNVLFYANYAYGIGAFQTASQDMDSGTRSYTIDALGEVTGYSDANGQTFSTTYDLLSRPLVRTDLVSAPDLTTTWTWGSSAANYNIGKLQSVTAASTWGSYVDAYVYDSKTRLSTDTKTLPGDGSNVYTYTYSTTTGLLNTLTYPVSTSSYQLGLQYGYSNGILGSITDTQSGTVYWTANATNARGQITQETLGNGVVTNRAYDAVTGWLSGIQAGVSGGATLQNNAFLYDEVGDVTQRQDNNQGLTENFYYDTDYRLDHSTLNGTLNLQMTYDTIGMGNIASRSDVAGGAAWTYDSTKKTCCNPGR